MIILRNKDCELLTHHSGYKPKEVMYNWKKKHFGLFKIWLGYQYYRLYDDKGYPVKNEDGSTPSGKHLEIIEIKWA